MEQPDEAKLSEQPGRLRIWALCGCGEYWCALHEDHASGCPCPPIEDWPTDPYETWVLPSGAR